MSEAAHEGPGLDDLTPDALLDLLTISDLAERTAQRAKLRIAHQWAVMHPATVESGTSTWGGDSFLLSDESLGGQGTPMVAAYAAEPLAIALGVSPASAATLIAEAVDLRYRLPQTWALVDALEVPAWKARQVAKLTHALPADGAAWVDERLAPRLKRCGARLIDTTVVQAIATYDPPRHAEREAKAQGQLWDVVLHTPTASEYAGTSQLAVTGDTPTLTHLYQRACAAAAAVNSGDEQPRRLPPLRARPRHRLRPPRPTGADPTRQPHPAVPSTPPRQDIRSMALHEAARRLLPMDRALSPRPCHHLTQNSRCSESSMPRRAS